jgi:hypothetical protein
MVDAKSRRDQEVDVVVVPLMASPFHLEGIQWNVPSVPPKPNGIRQIPIFEQRTRE